MKNRPRSACCLKDKAPMLKKKKKKKELTSEFTEQNK